MIVKNLIDMLEQLDQDAEVLAYDPNSECMESVTGAIYGYNKTVELETDDIS